MPVKILTKDPLRACKVHFENFENYQAKLEEVLDSKLY